MRLNQKSEPPPAYTYEPPYPEILELPLQCQSWMGAPGGMDGRMEGWVGVPCQLSSGDHEGLII